MTEPCKHWLVGQIATSETKCPFCEIDKLKNALDIAKFALKEYMYCGTTYRAPAEKALVTIGRMFDDA